MNRVLLFAKSPVKGLVKTRLLQGTPLSEEDVLCLYTSFLKDTIAAVVRSEADFIDIAFFPVDALGKMVNVVKEIGFQDHIDSGRISFFPQKGEGFDRKISTAVAESKNPSDALLIVGSDTPTLTTKLINSSFIFFSDLGEGFVLGPSGEGGVYLIGIKSIDEISFTDVFEQGVEIDNLTCMASKSNVPLLLLEELTDIDVSTDLISFICSIKALQYSNGFSNRNSIPVYTIRTIEEMNLSVIRDRFETRGKIIVKGNV